MASAMRHHRYDLQYLIYAVALRRYLRSRVPDFNWSTDFGGVYYLFVRGMCGRSDVSSCSTGVADSEATPGVFAAHPPEALLEQLDDLFGGGSLNA
jgi:exodeoxyribonuclease V beta subunit